MGPLLKANLEPVLYALQDWRSKLLIWMLAEMFPPEGQLKWGGNLLHPLRQRLSLVAYALTKCCQLSDIRV